MSLLRDLYNRYKPIAQQKLQQAENFAKPVIQRNVNVAQSVARPFQQVNNAIQRPVQRFAQQQVKPFVQQQIQRPIVQRNIQVAKNVSNTLNKYSPQGLTNEYITKPLITQPFARGGVELYNTAFNKKGITPTSPVAKELLGNNKVGTLPERYQYNKQVIQNNKYASVKNPALATGLGLAATGLAFAGDIVPIAPETKGSLIPKLAKATKAEEVIKLLGKGNKLAQDTRIVNSLVKETNPTKISRIIKSVNPLSGEAKVLTDYISNPKLYDKYPQLKNTKVVELSDSDIATKIKGWNNAGMKADAKTNTIYVKKSSWEKQSDNFKNASISHEIEHLLQADNVSEKDAFIRGVNTLADNGASDREINQYVKYASPTNKSFQDELWKIGQERKATFQPLPTGEGKVTVENIPIDKSKPMGGFSETTDASSWRKDTGTNSKEPIKIFRDVNTNKTVIMDGNTRVRQALSEGDKSIRAEVTPVIERPDKKGVFIKISDLEDSIKNTDITKNPNEAEKKILNEYYKYKSSPSPITPKTQKPVAQYVAD